MQSDRAFCIKTKNFFIKYDYFNVRMLILLLISNKINLGVI